MDARPLRVLQLLASPFVGGPERQVLGLASALCPQVETIFLSFAERGLARPFLKEARNSGFRAIELQHNAPHFWAAASEVANQVRDCQADVICCNGYKPDLVGWLAGRMTGIPVVAIAHGWTAATVKVRFNEALDRLVLRGMDCVVGVSAAQTKRVCRAGVPTEQVHTICNAIGPEAFVAADPAYAAPLRGMFPEPPSVTVVAVGRLSPEKGFEVLVDAARLARQHDQRLGFVVFGDGPERAALERRIAQRGLAGHFVLAGFRPDVGGFLPHADLAAMPSYTEGLPVALLEIFAAGVPVVATAVGGIPEVVEEGVNGHLVPAGDPTALAGRIVDLARSAAHRQALGDNGRRRVREEFSVAAQAEEYLRLFRAVVGKRAPRPCAAVPS
jgi:glycosyltransferase involved in cell wall biosynthesis